MNIILLSGGSGKRLWPLSNDVRSKQFLKIFKTANTYESMVQRMYRMIKAIDSNANITIATSQNQIQQLKSQLGDSVKISVEPCKRDTFPAIVLACAFLAKEGLALDEPVVVCPVDPLVEIEYFEHLMKLSEATKQGEYKLNLIGIKPTYPSTKYGYIVTQDGKVTEFKEKPDTNTAQKFISAGALWNGGVFSFKLDYVLEIAKNRFGTSDYDELYDNYESLEKISFDYAVVEKEENIGVIQYDGEWQDLGTWNTLTDAMDEPVKGNALLAESTNTHVVNELSIPMIVLGVDNAVVVATPDGILVSNKEMSSQLKDYLETSRPVHESK